MHWLYFCENITLLDEEHYYTLSQFDYGPLFFVLLLLVGLAHTSTQIQSITDESRSSIRRKNHNRALSSGSSNQGVVLEDEQENEVVNRKTVPLRPTLWIQHPQLQSHKQVLRAVHQIKALQMNYLNVMENIYPKALCFLVSCRSVTESSPI